MNNIEQACINFVQAIARNRFNFSVEEIAQICQKAGWSASDVGDLLNDVEAFETPAAKSLLQALNQHLPEYFWRLKKSSSQPNYFEAEAYVDDVTIKIENGRYYAYGFIFNATEGDSDEFPYEIYRVWRKPLNAVVAEIKLWLDENKKGKGS